MTALCVFDETPTTYSLAQSNPSGVVVYQYDQATRRACVGLTSAALTRGERPIPSIAEEVACGQVEHDGTVVAIQIDPAASAVARRRTCRGISDMRYLVSLTELHQLNLAAFEDALA